MTQEAGFPCIWPRRLRLPLGTLCPSALEMACLGLPRAGLSQPCLENVLLFEGGLLPHQEFMSLVYGSHPESLGHSFGKCQQHKYPLRCSLHSKT